MQAGEFFAQDQSSANGLYVNGTPTRRQKLYNGDTIQVGKFSIVFSSLGGPSVDKLQRNALLGDPSARARNPLNPEMTTALAPEDIGKFINMAGFNQTGQHAAQAPPRPAAPARTPRPGPARTPAPPRPRQAPPQHGYPQGPHSGMGGMNAGAMREDQRGGRSPMPPVPMQHGQHPQQGMPMPPHPNQMDPNGGRFSNGPGTLFGDRNQTAYLERQAQTFRTLTIVLGVAVVSLMGLTVALLAFG